MNTKNPYLYFNFAQQPIQFINPIQILTAHTVQEVIPCLEHVQQKVSKGYYAAGYLSYEASPAFNQDFPVKQKNTMPLLWFGIFQKAIKSEQIENKDQTYSFTEWKPNLSINNYYKNVEKIQSYIKNHQTEQVNYTITLESKFTGSAFNYYKQLERAQAANYSAYLNTGHFSVLSASPELFFHVKDGIITTKPMKGTINRGKTYAEDIRNAQWLQSSEKNRLENQLITHLVCEEMKDIAEDGTMKTSETFKVEKYPTVYQMTSTVQAKIAPQKNITDIFKALYPSGSVTGTPKKETMNIIQRLERKPREVYCGTIGYLTPDQEAIFNVPIRTVVIHKKNGKAEYGVGGAITINSNKKEEYNEILTKANLLTEHQPTFQLLETFGLINGELIVFENHIQRLKQSAKYFDFIINIPLIKQELQLIAKTHRNKSWKIRVLADKDGNYSIEKNEINQNPAKVSIPLANKPISKNNIFLYHKTTNRSIYDEQTKRHEDAFDVLLWNENKEITEFTTGNVVVEFEEKFITPPVECGLLPGTFREMLLRKEIIKEKKITIEELQKCKKIWYINSVRKWIPVNLLT